MSTADTDMARLEEAAPPRDSQAEMAVLGAMMGSIQVADEISELLTAGDFYKPKHATIYTAILDLTSAGNAPDPISVVHALGDDLTRVGGAPYLLECVQAPLSVASGTHYAGIVAELAQRRRILEAGAALQAIARRDGDIAEVVESAEQTVYEATASRQDRVLIESVGDLIGPRLEVIDRIAAGEVPSGIQSGWRDLDQLLGGARPGQLIVPAGRTAMGKSVFAQNWMIHAARTVNRPFLIISNELSKDQMMNRLIAQLARVPIHLIDSGKVSQQDLERMAVAEQEIKKLPLWLVENVRTTPAIRSLCRRFKQKHGDLAMVDVDYLQRLKSPDGKGHKDRHVEVGAFANDLKDLGFDLGIPVIAPAQLNRNPESRTGRKGANIPSLSDLRESGDIEQTADVVVLIYRPDYYDRDTPRAGEVDFIVAKHRNGATDTITVAHQLHIQRFVDIGLVPRPEEPPLPPEPEEDDRLWD